MAKKERSGNGQGKGEKSEERERIELDSLIESDANTVGKDRREQKRATKLVGSSPYEVQLKFLKGLMDNSTEADEFLRDPKQYSIDHGVLLDAEIVKDVLNSTVFDVNVSSELLDKYGIKGVDILLDMRKNCMACVSTSSTVVYSAGDVVVEAVNSAFRGLRPEDLLAIKGLGPNKIRMPGGSKSII